MSFILFLIDADKLHKYHVVQKQEKMDSSQENSKTRTRNWICAYKLLFNPRLIGTAPATPYVASYSKPSSLLQRHTSSASPQVTRTEIQGARKKRRQYVLRQSLILLSRFIALCIFYDPDVHHYMFNKSHNNIWTHTDFSPEKKFLFKRLADPRRSPVTSRELLIRCHLVLDLVLPDWLLLSSYHDILAIIAVSLDLNSPEEWPPLFGSIFEATTVRKYWSCFWHALIRRSFTAHASLLSRRVLGLRRGSLEARYVDNGLVFLLSGLMHTLVDWKLSETRAAIAGELRSGFGCRSAQ